MDYYPSDLQDLLDYKEQYKYHQEETMEDQVEIKLRELDEAEARLDLLRMELEEYRSEIMEGIQDELDALQMEWEPGIETVQEQISRIKAEIKQMVIQRGASVKIEVAPGQERSAIFVKGRTSWDSKALEGYAMAHPEIDACKKVGNPSVRFK